MIQHPHPPTPSHRQPAHHPRHGLPFGRGPQVRVLRFVPGIQNANPPPPAVLNRTRSTQHVESVSRTARSRSWKRRSMGGNSCAMKAPSSSISCLRR